jgi:hypothetical protein
MKNLKNKLIVVITLSGLLTACGGGGDGATTTQEQGFPISEMTNQIIAENLDHPDHTTWDLDNFTVVDDIDGDLEAESTLNTMLDEMVKADQAKQQL